MSQAITANITKSGFRWQWLLYLAAAPALIAAACYFHLQDLLKQAIEWIGLGAGAVFGYEFGLTRVKLGHYILASWIGLMPAWKLR